MPKVNHPKPESFPDESMQVSLESDMVKPSGPVIEYADATAKDVVFTPNPQAKKYVVYSNGTILETL